MVAPWLHQDPGRWLGFFWTTTPRQERGVVTRRGPDVVGAGEEQGGLSRNGGIRRKRLRGQVLGELTLNGIHQESRCFKNCWQAIGHTESTQNYVIEPCRVLHGALVHQLRAQGITDRVDRVGREAVGVTDDLPAQGFPRDAGSGARNAMPGKIYGPDSESCRR